jgi:hypothetical protein
VRLNLPSHPLIQELPVPESLPSPPFSVSLNANNRHLRSHSCLATSCNLEVWFSRLRGHPESPEVPSAKCSTVESEVIAEVLPAIPTMQAGLVDGAGYPTRSLGVILLTNFGERPSIEGAAQHFISKKSSRVSVELSVCHVDLCT